MKINVRPSLARRLSSYSSVVKEFTCSTEDLGSTPELGRSPGEGKGSPPQYSGLENSRHCVAHGVTKSRTWLSGFHFHWLQHVPSSLTANVTEASKCGRLRASPAQPPGAILSGQCSLSSAPGHFSGSRSSPPDPAQHTPGTAALPFASSPALSPPPSQQPASPSLTLTATNAYLFAS